MVKKKEYKFVLVVQLIISLDKQHRGMYQGFRC